MPRKFRDTITAIQAKVPQPNGNIYVYDQQYRYDPVTKKNVRISNKLIGKILKGTTEIVPTRAKKPDGQGPLALKAQGLPPASPEGSELPRAANGGTLSSILQWAGEASGIDADLHSAMLTGDADMTVTMARFLVATGNETAPHIGNWQLTHPTPYGAEITEPVCLDLLRTLSEDEKIQRDFFQARIDRFDDRPLLALDGASNNLCSSGQGGARFQYGVGKDADSSIKYLILYADAEQQPIAITQLSHNVPDALSLTHTLQKLEAWGERSPQLVSDIDHVNESHLAELCRSNIDFIVVADPDSEWIRKEVDACIDKLQEPDNLAPEGGIYLQERVVTRDLTYRRKYASRKKHLKAGDTEVFTRNLHLYICFDPKRKEEADVGFLHRIRSIKQDLESGIAFTDLTEQAQLDAEQYLDISVTKQGRVIEIELNRSACRQACRYHGCFTLIANREKDGFAALAKCRKRELLEEFFRRRRDDPGSSRPRVWHADNMRGRLTVQFVALCYEDFLRSRVRHVMKTLEDRVRTADENAETGVAVTLDRRLLNWLKARSFHEVLEWFDVYDNHAVTDEIRHKRWSSEIARRDRRFLQLLTGEEAMDWF